MGSTPKSTSAPQRMQTEVQRAIVAKKPVRRIAIGPETGFSEVCAVIMRGVLVVVGLGMIYTGFEAQPESAIHQIYQLNAIASGFILFGVWGAVDSLRKEPKVDCRYSAQG